MAQQASLGRYSQSAVDRATWRITVVSVALVVARITSAARSAESESAVKGTMAVDALAAPLAAVVEAQALSVVLAPEPLEVRGALEQRPLSPDRLSLTLAAVVVVVLSPVAQGGLVAVALAP